MSGDACERAWPELWWLKIAATTLVIAAPGAHAVPIVCPQSVDVVCEASCSAEIAVLVTGPVLLDALGLDIVFDSSALSYAGFSPGPQFENWQVLDAQVIGPGRLRMGGFDATPVSLPGTTALATLHFSTNQPAGCTQILLESFVDDLATAAPCSSTSTWETSTTGYPDNGFIGVFADSSGANCCFSVGADQTLWVLAQLEGGSSTGVNGAEFRIQVEPPAPGATFVWTASNDVVTSEGDPVDNNDLLNDGTGVRLTLSACRSQSPLILGSLRVMNLVGAHDLVVRRHDQPSQPRHACAQFASCQAAECTVICMATTTDPGDDPEVFRSYVNAACENLSCGFVAVSSKSWGVVKALFR